MIMKKNLTSRALPLMTLAGALALFGCTDNNYDLGNLDKTIAVGNEEGFALPGNNSTSAMVLDDVLDIEGNDFIEVGIDGSYYISRGADENDVDPALPVVDEIELTQVSDESDYEYTLNETLDVEEARRAGSLSPTEESIYDFTFEKLDQVADVLGMTLANLTAGINVNLNFSDALKVNVDYLRQVTIDLPDFFDVDITPRENDVNVSFEKQTNTLKMTNLKQNGVHLMMKLNGLDFAKGLTPDAHNCYLTFGPEGVKMVGSIWIDAVYDFEAAAAQSRGLKAEEQSNLKILCHSYMDQKVILTRATGHFDPKIDLGNNIGSFEVNNLPSFLDDDEVHLRVKEPELRVWIDNNMDMRGLLTNASINAIDSKGREVKIAIDTDGLAIDPHTGMERNANGDSLQSTRTALIISDRAEAPADRPAHTYYGKPKEGKLSDLLYNIPRKVTFDIDVKADEKYEGTIQLGYKDKETKQGWYKIQPSYEVYAPLAFDAGSAIVYRDSITGWHKDLDDISLSDGATVTLLADVHNNIPLDLKMHANAIELTGNDQWKDMDKNLVSVTITDLNDNEDFRIKAGTESSAETTRVKITLKQNSKQGFKQIDGITYSASCLAPEDAEKQGIKLNNKSQQLKVDNIAVTLRGRVVFDLND